MKNNQKHTTLYHNSNVPPTFSSLSKKKNQILNDYGLKPKPKDGDVSKEITL